MAAQINGVTYSPTTPIASPVPTTSGTRTGGTASNTSRPGGSSGSGAAPGASSGSPVFYLFSSLFIGILAAGQAAGGGERAIPSCSCDDEAV